MAALAVLALAGAGTLRLHTRAALAQGADNVSVQADLEGRRLMIQNGDTIVASYPVAIGMGSKPTPPGHYKIAKIIWNPAWIPPNEPWARGKKPEPAGAAANPMKVVKIIFKDPDYYIHGTGDEESLGEAASHGCLRMDVGDAYRVARYLMEHGGQPRDESWFERVLHFRSETKTVYLDHPIPMTVE